MKTQPPAETPAIDDEEETYELQVPPNTKPGSKLKLTIPGMPDKVVITVPPGALPGYVISFSMPKSKGAVQAKLLEQAKAVTRLQSRLRGVTLMAISNQTGRMLLSTGNKSEVAVGYTTLYGDSCGGYNVLKDVYKTQVYQLANWRNFHSMVIPQRSITKAPSAELAPNQKDEDQLPPYEVLDAILMRHIEERMSAEDIVADGFEMDIVTKVLRMVRLSEYKRRQSCPGVKLTSMMFGRDRRYPLTCKF